MCFLFCEKETFRRRETRQIFRCDESGNLNFLRSKTLGERLRDTKTWASSRRSSEKELTPILDNDKTPDDPNSTDLSSMSGYEVGSQSRLSRLFSLGRSTESQGGLERE